MNDVALMGTFSLVNKRTENTSIFVVRRFFALTRLLIISFLAQKIICLESLGFESSGIGFKMDGNGHTGGHNLNTYKAGFQMDQSIPEAHSPHIERKGPERSQHIEGGGDVCY